MKPGSSLSGTDADFKTAAERSAKVELCSIVHNGKVHIEQTYYRCHTCNLTTNKGVCTVSVLRIVELVDKYYYIQFAWCVSSDGDTQPCARKCHAGHKLSKPLVGYAFSILTPERSYVIYSCIAY